MFAVKQVKDMAYCSIQQGQVLFTNEHALDDAKYTSKSTHLAQLKVRGLGYILYFTITACYYLIEHELLREGRGVHLVQIGVVVCIQITPYTANSTHP